MNIGFIKKIKLLKIAKHHPVAFSVALALHFMLLFGLIFSSIQRLDKPEEQLKKTSPKFIPKAVTIDLSEIKKESKRIIDAEKKKVAKRKREERHLKEVEDQRYKEQQKINQLKAKTKKAKKDKILADKKAKEAKQQRQTEAKKFKKAKQQRQAEAKKFKKEQAQRQKEKKVQLQEDQERKAEQQKILDELKVSYINQIAARVREQWRYSGAEDNWTCEVHILQNEGGEVKKVELKSCNVDDKSKEKSFKNSIKRAVNKASPLPNAPDKSVFDNQVIFHFKGN
ncbi:TolA protein [uncultured Candidatus Thioglobus sp.]|nr:TolA protein [uncultured Candidatus Thioglobus sp.]